MAWGRLLQLGKPLTGLALVESAPVWWRSLSSFSGPALETCGTSPNVFRHESATQVMRSSRDSLDAVVCGRGDKKTKRGKRFKGSFGNPREKRGTTTRRLRKSWDLPFDPLVPVHTQPFPPLLS